MTETASINNIFSDDDGIIFLERELHTADRRDQVFPLHRQPCNRENMLKLVAALESGKYHQGNEKLRPSQRKYCCLGVACDISGLGKWDDKGLEGGYFYVINSDDPLEAEMADYYLPEAVQEWLGVTDNNPAVSERVAQDGNSIGLSLGELNDSDTRYGFPEIAAVLRKVFLEE